MRAPRPQDEFPPLDAFGNELARSSSARRRGVMLVCLCAASLLFLGLSRQKALAAVAEVGQDINQTLQSSLRTPVKTSLGIFRRPVRVGIQIGHLDPQDQPDELENLRYNTGGYWNNVNEVDINQATALMLRDMLEAEGMVVDLLPATVNPNYKADLFLAIHADASPEPHRRGYKSAYWLAGRNPHDAALKHYIDEAYFYFTGLPDDDANVSGSMLEYYAFNRQKFKHSVSSKTPALIVELGYISHPDDLRIIADPVNPAYALKLGVLNYLKAQGRINTREPVASGL